MEAQMLLAFFVGLLSGLLLGKGHRHVTRKRSHTVATKALNRVRGI
jgi:hypothetical protein